MKRAPRLWRGTIRVDALLFDQRDAARRILSMWEPGSSIVPCESGWLLCFARNRWMRAQEAPGQAFVRVGALWSALCVDEQEASRWPPRSLLRARHGVVAAEAVPVRNIDPSELIDVSAFALEPLVALASPRPAAQRAAPIAASPSTREILEVGAAAEEVALVTRALRTKKPAAEGLGKGGTAAAATALSNLMRWIWRGAERDGSGRGGGWSFMDGLRSLANRMILSTRLASVLGRRQAQYMSDLVDMLERQRFDEALRFAIPLSDDVVDSLGQLTFLTPSARSDFSLNLSPAQGSTVMAASGDSDLADRLRRLYRRAAEQFESAGKIENAAFVLADLLNLPEEAVSLLERHGKLRLAARLAEARNLAPDLMVRQWLLAGDRARAIALARRHEAYELAVRRLESSHRGLADSLRVEWAEALATRGAYAAASEAIWVVEEERPRARAWLDEAIARRGVAGARALARKLELVEEERPMTLRQIAGVLAEEDSETATARVMLVTRLAANALAAPEMRSALRLGIRSRLRDAATLSRPMKAAELDTMAKAVGDGAFRADLMSLPSLPHLAPRLWAAGTESIVHSIDAADRGTSNVIDAVILEDGLVVAALGEQGTVLLHGEADGGAAPGAGLSVRAVGTAGPRPGPGTRDESWRVTRIDFVRRHATYWRDFRLDDFADTYDGATWFAAVDGALYAIDTAEEQLTSIWYNPDVGRSSLVRTPSSVVLLTAGECGSTRFRRSAAHPRARRQERGQGSSGPPCPAEDSWRCGRWRKGRERRVICAPAARRRSASSAFSKGSLPGLATRPS